MCKYNETDIEKAPNMVENCTICGMSEHFLREILKTREKGE